MGNFVLQIGPCRFLKLRIRTWRIPLVFPLCSSLSWRLSFITGRFPFSPCFFSFLSLSPPPLARAATAAGSTAPGGSGRVGAEAQEPERIQAGRGSRRRAGGLGRRRPAQAGERAQAGRWRAHAVHVGPGAGRRLGPGARRTRGVGGAGGAGAQGRASTGARAAVAARGMERSGSGGVSRSGTWMGAQLARASDRLCRRGSCG
jgi:hypothetical protein